MKEEREERREEREEIREREREEDGDAIIQVYEGRKKLEWCGCGCGCVGVVNLRKGRRGREQTDFWTGGYFLHAV